MKNSWMSSAVIVGGCLFALGLGGCAHSRQKAQPEPLKDAVGAVPALPGLKAEPSVRNEGIRSIPELRTVHFDFDSAFLKPGDKVTLVKNADWLKNHPDVKAQVTGNCDQRGTIEYNLALGQRRAKAVRDYYVALGISGDRVATISYGKEKPVCQEAGQNCWQKNRRAETLEITSGVK